MTAFIIVYCLAGVVSSIWLYRLAKNSPLLEEDQD